MLDLMNLYFWPPTTWQDLTKVKSTKSAPPQGGSLEPEGFPSFYKFVGV
jgi:hypothetical protein